MQLVAAEALLRHSQLSEAYTILQQTPREQRGWEWSLLHGLLNGYRWEYQLPQGVVGTAVALNDYATTWVVGRSDGKLEIYHQDITQNQSRGYPFALEEPWDPFTHYSKPIIVELGGRAPTSIRFNSSYDKLLVAGSDGLLLVLDPITGTVLLDAGKEFSKSVYEAVWSPDNQQFAAASWELTGSDPPVLGFVKVIEASTGKVQAKLPCDSHPATSIAFGPYQKLYVGTWGEAVYSFSIPDGRQVWKCDLKVDGKYAAVQRISLFALSYLMVTGKDGMLRMLSTLNGAVMGKYPSAKLGAWSNVVVGRPQVNPIVGDDLGMMHFFRIGVGSALIENLQVPAHRGAMRDIAVSSLGNKVITTGEDGRVCGWNPMATLNGYAKLMENGPWDLPLTLAGDKLILPGSDSVTRVYDVENFNFPTFAFKATGNCGAFSADGSIIAIAGHDSLVRIYNSGAITTLKGLDGSAYGMDMARGTDHLAVTGGHSMLIWDTGNYTLLKRFQFPGHSMYQVRYCPDGVQLIAAATDGKLFICNSRSGRILDSIPNRSQVRKIAVHPEMPLVAAGGEDGTFEVWNYQTKTRVSILKGHTKMAPGAVFHPSLPLLLTVSNDRSLRTWDVRTGECRFSMLFDHELYNIALAHGGYRLFLTGTEGVLHTFTLR